MWVAAWVTKAVDGGAGLVDRSRTFFDVNVVLLTACALATTWLIARTAGRRPWDAALFALAPGLVLTAFINWDLLAVALTAGFLLAWARSRPVLAGVLLGLAVAAKFYPVVLLGPLLVLALRAGRMPAFWRTAGSAVLAWLVVNLPVAVLWPSGWGAFYSLSQERGAGFGSLWYVFERAGHPLPSWALNPVAVGLAAAAVPGHRLRWRWPHRGGRDWASWRSWWWWRSPSPTRSTHRSTCCGCSPCTRWPGRAGAS